MSTWSLARRSTTYAEMGRFLTSSGEETDDEAQAGHRRGGTARPEPDTQPVGHGDSSKTALNTAFLSMRIALLSIVMGVALLLTGTASSCSRSGLSVLVPRTTHRTGRFRSTRHRLGQVATGNDDRRPRHRPPIRPVDPRCPRISGPSPLSPSSTSGSNDCMRTEGRETGDEAGAAVDLYWIPLGAGQHVVRLSGRLFEAISARVQRRRPCDLYHSALVVAVPEGRFVIEQTPVIDDHGERRGVVVEGPVASRLAGRSRLFRYEVRRWRDGVIPDVAEAVSSPVRLTDDPTRASQILDLVPSVPALVWGRDESHMGDMWNSNSVIAWLLASVGLDRGRIHPPPGGRAPGWRAGLERAARDAAQARSGPTRERLMIMPPSGRGRSRSGQSDRGGGDPTRLPHRANTQAGGSVGGVFSERSCRPSRSLYVGVPTA